MPSRLIDRYRADSQAVATGAEEVAEEVGAALAERFRPFLQDGESQVDWVLAQKLASRLLASRDQRLDGIDLQLELERTTNKKLRADRQKIATKVRSQLRAARHLIDESFGKDVAVGIFRQRRVSEIAPERLVRLARETVEALRSPELLPSLNLAGEDVGDPADLAGKLERRANELAEHLEVLIPKRKRETMRVGAKQEGWQEATKVRLQAQDMLVGFYRGAGFDHLATRLRPKRRRKAEEEEGKLATQDNQGVLVAAGS